MQSKNAFSHRRYSYSLWIAACCVGLSSLSYAAVPVVLPILARKRGISEFETGTIIGLSAFVFILAAPVWGKIADSRGAKFVLLTNMAGYTIGGCFFAAGTYAGLNSLITKFELLCALGAALAISSALGAGTFPAAVSVAASVSKKENRASAVAVLSAAFSVGMAIGPAVAAFFAGHSLYVPHIVIAILALGACSLCAFLRSGGRERRETKNIVAVKLHDRRIRPFLLMTFGIFFVLSVLNLILGFTVQDKLGLEGPAAASLTGNLFFVLGSCVFVAQVLLVRMPSRPASMVIGAGTACAVAGLVLLCLSSHLPLFFFSVGVIGFGFGISGPVISAACSLNLAPDEQGSGAGWMSSTRSVGGILGSFLAGYLYSVDALFPLIVATLIILFVFIVALTHPTSGN